MSSCGHLSNARSIPTFSPVVSGAMTIVVGNLATSEGVAALEVAVSEASQRKQPLIVVSGTGDPDPAFTPVGETTQRLADAGVQVRWDPGTGDLAEDLVRIATQTSAELVVIGLRRRRPVGKLILGAGAQRILIEAPCPVLAIKV